jgi:two-component system sensor histidine kinase PhcS
LTRQNQSLESAITQLKETEIQLVQAEKLASLGRLSAGIIHEVNNPLNFATTALFALRNQLRRLPGEPQREMLEILSDVDEGVNRVRNIVSELRTFTYPSQELVEDVVVVDAVAMALRLLSHEWRDQVRIDQSIPADLVVLINRNKFVQVMVNLFQNALDALATKRFDGEIPCITIEGKISGANALITCRDNGPGVPASLLGKIFDPFFTTKDVGKGLGLGLSICYRILEQFGGGITVRTEAGQYTEFVLRLPRPAEKAAATLHPKIDS